MIGSKTAYDLVFLALREIGPVSLGDTIQDDMAQEALLILNTIRAEYGITTKTYKPYDETYLSTENKSYITLGTDRLGVAGDIATRPSTVKRVILIMGAADVSPNIELDILTYDQYRSISLTNIFAVPRSCYIDMDFPYQKIWLFPGLASGYTIRVVGNSYMAEYETLQDPYIDPPEYFSLFYLSLAARLAAKYGQDVPIACLSQIKSISQHIAARGLLNSLTPMANAFGQGGPGFNFLAGR
jgi:hypothetical protein